MYLSLFMQETYQMKKQLSVLLVLLIILLPIMSLAEQSSATTEVEASVDTDFDTARAIANFMETHYDTLLQRNISLLNSIFDIIITS